MGKHGSHGSFRAIDPSALERGGYDPYRHAQIRAAKNDPC